MARDGFKTFVNFGSREQPEPEIKRRLCAFVGGLQGWYEVEFRPRRETRSLQQMRYYWAVPVAMFRSYLQDQEPEPFSAEAVHGLLKDRFLKADVVDHRTGEVVGQRTRSTSELSTAEMADYIERVRDWLAEFNLQVPAPDPEWRQAAGARRSS